MKLQRRYLIWLAFTAVGGTLLVGALNFLVDPYDRFGLNRLGVYISAEREFKGTEFPRFAPDAVLLGNSRAALIDAGQLPEYHFFNAAFGSAEAEEIRFFVDRYVTNQKVVVLCLDPFSFGPLKEPVRNPFEPLTARRALEYILNLQNVEYSVRTISSSLAGKQTDLSPNGSFHEANWAAQADNADEETARRRIREFSDKLARYRLEPARLQPLRDIRDTLKKRGISLLVCFPPVNAKVWQELQGTRGLAEMLRTGEAIKEIFPQTVDLMTSEYSAPEGFFRGDPVHYRSAVGRRFLTEKVLATAGSSTASK